MHPYNSGSCLAHGINFGSDVISLNLPPSWGYDTWTQLEQSPSLRPPVADSVLPFDNNSGVSIVERVGWCAEAARQTDQRFHVEHFLT